ncbi:MAG TPA: bis(5'-nucleosyl)-tetraphosphatase (symmetrical) YqeK [Thermotogota bacterium]|nr:bis(5'-nucleosyl)-tetraphosphatase (symmetrical) YqeK [Thermotogota bacterium]
MKSDMIVKEITKRLKNQLNPKRLQHTMGVLDYSVLLADKHNEEQFQVKIAALYHDAFRNRKRDELLVLANENQMHLSDEELKNPLLLHGRLAADDLKKRYPELSRIDEIAEAVHYHTSGYQFGSKIGKIIFVADSLEKNRVYPGIDELRKLSLQDLDAAFFLVLKGKIKYALQKGHLLLKETVFAYNRILINGETINDKHS